MRGSISSHAVIWWALVGTAFAADNAIVLRAAEALAAGQSTSGPEVKSHPVSDRILAAAIENFRFSAPGEAPSAPVALREFELETPNALHLPRFIVRGERPPLFSEREFYTRKGLLEVAKQRYLTETHRALNPFPFMQNSYAMRRYREDERSRQMGEMDRLVNLAELSGELEETQKLRRESKRIFNRGFHLGERWISGAALNAK